MKEIKIPINDTNSIKEYKSEKSNEIKILWLNIAQFSPTQQILICCGGVFVFYLLYGYLQELIFTLEGFKPYGWYLTLIQFAYYSIFGYIEKRVKNITRLIPIKTYLILAILTLGTMGFSNSSLGYLNYPTQVIFKCCKLIPVLIGSIVIQKKQYGVIDFLSAGFMCAGLTLFTLADSQISPNFNTLGVFMISCALFCDALIGNIQEKSMKMHKASNTEVVLYSYFIGFIYLFMIMLFSGYFFQGFIFCSQHIQKTYGYAFIFSISGYLGIQFVLCLVRVSGAFVAATITTCRKAITIIISFIFFAKPFTFQYIWSGLLVVVGIYLNIYNKNRSKIDIKNVLRHYLRVPYSLYSKFKHQRYHSAKLSTV